MAESILDFAMRKQGITPERDPHDLCTPLKAAAKEPECHCPAPQRHRLGGQRPLIDLEAREVVCGTCLKRVTDSCKRREVQHLRSLLRLRDEQLDLDSIRDLLL